jgi:hypothetical protein
MPVVYLILGAYCNRGFKIKLTQKILLLPQRKIREISQKPFGGVKEFSFVKLILVHPVNFCLKDFVDPEQLVREYIA